MVYKGTARGLMQLQKYFLKRRTDTEYLYNSNKLELATSEEPKSNNSSA